MLKDTASAKDGFVIGIPRKVITYKLLYNIYYLSTQLLTCSVIEDCGTSWEPCRLRTQPKEAPPPPPP